MHYLETKKLCLLLGFCSAVSAFQFRPGEAPNVLTTLFEWNQLDFEYQNAADRQRDIDGGFFVPGIPAIIDADVFYSQIAAAVDVDVAFPEDDKRKRYFVSTPRFQAGIPATLGVVLDQKIDGNNLLRPYPNWDWHKNPRECRNDRLICVYRTQIDSCGRLWVLDTGNYQNELICAPQILAFDLKTDKLIHRYEIPSSVIFSNSLLVTPSVDVTSGCSNPFIYAADCQANALVVYDATKNSSWKIVHKSMYPDPNLGTFTILGESFDLMDGILGIALDAKSKRLYYHAMTSNIETVVGTKDLRNQSNSQLDMAPHPEIFHTFEKRRKSQSPALAVDKNGILYFGDVNQVTLNCWNPSNKGDIKILSSNKTILQFTSGVKVIDAGPKQQLYVLTSRFQKVALGTLSDREKNFRILKLELDQWVSRRCN